MKRITSLTSRFRESSPGQPEHDEWPPESGKPRILIENPDRAELWAHEEILRDAGYEVASCLGPTHADVPGAHTACPLLTEGHCRLVSEADVVVSTASLGESRAILAKLSARVSPRLVVEGTRSQLARDADVTGGATEIPQPVTPESLLAAVKRALSGTSAVA